MADDTRDRTFLDGQFLIAMPQMQDPRFARSVIFLCAHSADGAMGIVINRIADEVAFSDLLVQLDVVKEPAAGATVGREIRVHRGGPVETARGFVLHSSDFEIESATLSIGTGISLTATLDILREIAQGRGPAQALLALGYAGWAPGQLEGEIHANGWLTCAADADILFDEALDTKYDRALAKIGVDPRMLSMNAGHA